MEPAIKRYPLYSSTYCLNSEKWQHGFTMYIHRDWKLIQKNKVLKKSPHNKTCSRTFSLDMSNKSTETSKWVGQARKGWHQDRSVAERDSYGTCLGKPSELHIHLFHINLSPLGFSSIINAALKQNVQIKVSTTFGEHKLLLYNR